MAKTIDNRVRDEAADWVTRIQSGEVDREHSTEFRAWLESSHEHRRVFRRMLHVFGQTELLSSHAAARATPRAAPATARSLPGYFAAAAAVLIAVAAGFWMLAGSGVGFETQTGERLLTSLEDGSSVHLNAQSAVEFEFSDDARRATMPRGEIVFSVASSDPRPFIVHAGDVDVEVTGTSFQVTRYDDETVVSVLEGSVRVRAVDDTGAVSDGRQLALSMRAGEQVSWQGGKLASPVSIDVNRVAGWREGWLYLDNRPVSELVGRLDRQYDDRIELEDDSIADRRVSVAVKLGRPGDTFDRLEMLLPFEFEEQPGNRRVVRARR